MKRTTRVRYKVNNLSGQLESTQSFLSSEGHVLRVLISKGDNGYSVSIGGSEEMTVSQNLPSLFKAKSMAKAILKEKGVDFFDEVRKKSTVNNEV